MKKVYFLFIALFFIAYSARAAYIFTPDKVAYFLEVESYFNNVNFKNPKHFEELRLNKEYLTQDDMEFIAALTNEIFKTTYNKKSLLESFFHSIAAIIERDKNYTSYFIENAYNFFIDNKGKFQLYTDNMANFASNFNLKKLSSHEWVAEGAEILDLTRSFDVVLDNINVVCRSRIDSFKIENTSGVYHILEDTFVGNGGSIKNESGTSEAVLTHYSIDLRKKNFKADSVAFKKETEISIPAIGKYEITLNLSPSKQNNQSFLSYDSKSYSFDEGKVKVEGFLSFKNNKIKLVSTKKQPAKIELSHEGKKFIVTKSNQINITDSTISTYKAKVKVYLESPKDGTEESIVGEYTSVDYDIQEKKLTVKLDSKKKFSESFFSTYHNASIGIEQFEWKLGTDSIFFKNLPYSSFNKAKVWSNNLFDKELFLQLNYDNYIHPMVKFKNFSDQNGDYELGIEHFARFSGSTSTQVKQLVLSYVKHGFTSYNSTNNTFDIKPKLFFYLRSITEKSDYDLLGLTAKNDIHIPNAILNTKSLDLTINKVSPISLDKNKNIVAIPNQDGIILKNNFNFQFHGDVDARKMYFRGEEFFFDYDKYHIRSDSIRLAQIYVDIKKDSLSTDIRKVKSILRNLSGRIHIDHTNNKSGRFKNEKYPAFQSLGQGKVYYDNLRSGGYKKEVVRFELDPFIIENLTNYKNKDHEFLGTLKTNNIVPDIKNALTIQKDLTLGFEKFSFDKKIPLYNHLGEGKIEVSLNDEGLRGKGDFTFKKMTNRKADFRFYEEKAVGTSEKTVLVPSEDLPGFDVQKIDFTWNTTIPNLTVQTDINPIIMYKDEFVLFGQTTYYGDSLLGSGNSKVNLSNIYSDKYNFRNQNVYATDAKFYLTKTETGMDFVLPKVDINIDWRQRQIFFGNKSTEEFFYTFGGERLKVFHEPISYSLNENIIRLKKDLVSQNPDRKGNVEYKIKKEDIIYFSSESSNLDITNQKLWFNGVEDFTIADANITPFKASLTFDNNPILETLKNAKILIMNHDSSFFHEFSDVTANILSSSKYDASGQYQYTDINSKIYNLFFSDIKVESQTTTAKTEVLEKDHFQLSPKFRFQGIVSFKGNEEFLTFKGATEIISTCNRGETFKIGFKKAINPNNITIDIPQKAYNRAKTKLYTGFFVNTVSKIMYPIFISQIKNYNDLKIAQISGYIHFDYNKNLFIIQSTSDTSKLEKKLTLHDQTCKMTYYGAIDLLPKVEPLMVKTYSVLQQTLLKGDFYGRLDLGLFTKVPKSIYNGLSKNILFNTLRDALYKEEKRLIELENLKIKDFSKRNDTKIIFREMKLNWIPSLNSFMVKNEFPIYQFSNDIYNYKVKGDIQISYKKNDEKIIVFGKPQSQEWFYFEFIDDMTKISSTYYEVNKMVETGEKAWDKEASKAEKKKITGELKSEQKYSFAPPGLKSKFVIKTNKTR